MGCGDCGGHGIIVARPAYPPDRGRPRAGQDRSFAGAGIRSQSQGGKRGHPHPRDRRGQAYNTVTVKSQVTGTIVKIAYRQGQFVKKGDLLVQIDQRP
jgi:biotin carboxyl carrier protein